MSCAKHKTFKISLLRNPIKRTAKRQYKTTGNTTLFDKENPAARWTKKGVLSYFGYKNHIKGDRHMEQTDTGTRNEATTTHNSQPTDMLLRESNTGQQLSADCAYLGQEEMLEKYRLRR